MIPISIEEFTGKYIEWNPEENAAAVKLHFESVLKRKLSGAKCPVCGAPIWALGSALSKFDGCFACITKEHDNSRDLEFK